MTPEQHIEHIGGHKGGGKTALSFSGPPDQTGVIQWPPRGGIPGPVLWLCMLQSEYDDPVKGSITKECATCHQPVWYDPKASIPALGTEHIICTHCMDKALAQDVT